MKLHLLLNDYLKWQPDLNWFRVSFIECFCHTCCHFTSQWSAFCGYHRIMSCVFDWVPLSIWDSLIFLRASFFTNIKMHWKSDLYVQFGFPMPPRRYTHVKCAVAAKSSCNSPERADVQSSRVLQSKGAVLALIWPVYAEYHIVRCDKEKGTISQEGSASHFRWRCKVFPYFERDFHWVGIEKEGRWPLWLPLYFELTCILSES